MAGRSKEAERQNRALQGILEGKPVEKNYVQVGYEGKGPENKGGDTKDGHVTSTYGDMETVVGFVTNYNSKILEDGSVECSVEITS